MVLDTAVDAALRREGLAREVVSAWQAARKDAGLEVSDRIRVSWATDDRELAAAIEAHHDAIAREVLAVELVPGAGAATAKIEGSELGYTLTKA
ncbi:MAG: hypothetical protein IPK07_13490 [Deltaproteobacteria bacterium]|nr:hypothetical protein [Deltaproteobacteria bacterium]